MDEGQDKWRYFLYRYNAFDGKFERPNIISRQLDSDYIFAECAPRAPKPTVTVIDHTLKRK